MKLFEISPEAAAGKAFAKEHAVWYRERAAFYDITIDGQADGVDNYPIVRTGGSWYGGTLKFKGGVTAEKFAEFRMPFHFRVEHFVAELAEQLSKFYRDGYSIRLNQMTYTQTLSSLPPLKSETPENMRSHAMAIIKSRMPSTDDPLETDDWEFPRLIWYVSNQKNARYPE